MTARQLKNAILQEAIQGRLVPQDPNDEPASVLLERIRKEKQQLVKEGKLKKKDLEEKPISEDEIPFEIPESWEWVRWGMLGEYKKGPFGSSLTKSMFVPQSDEAVKVYEQKNAIQKDYTLGDYFISKEKYETMTGFTVRPGDIIVSCAGTIGETYLLPPEAPIGIINQALMRAKLHLDSIIPFWLLHFQYILLIENRLKGSGSAIKNIPPFEVLKAMPVPLPPLAEQKRIVAKIEELLPKVEEYGKAQEKLNKLNEELPERLKKSILQEAIEGRLVPQDPSDEPASALLAKIREDKKQLVKEGKLKKKGFEEKPISEEEIPFDIPESWEWCRLESLMEFINGRAYKKDELLDKGKYKVLRVGNLFTNDSWYYSNMELPEEKYCYKDDLLYAWSASFGPYIWTGEKTIFHYHIWNVKYNCDVLYREYLYYFFLIDKMKIRNSTTGSTMVHVSMENMKPRLIPLPPLAEQKRIVAKIEELLSKIDKLNS